MAAGTSDRAKLTNVSSQNRPAFVTLTINYGRGGECHSTELNRHEKSEKERPIRYW